MKFEFLKSLVDAVAAGGTLQEQSLVSSKWSDVAHFDIVKAIKVGHEHNLRIKPKPRDWWETESGKGPTAWITRHQTFEEIPAGLRGTAIHVQEITSE